MLDYVGWYLVELERKLRGRRSAQSSADLLLETRSHLEERVADLVAKGIDPISAAKAAITDFGDPGSVVHAYAHPVDTPRKAPKWALLLVAIGASIAVPFAAYMGIIVGVPYGFGMPWIPLMAILITGVLVVALGAWTRRIVVIPAIILMFGVALGFTCWLASATLNIDSSAGAPMVLRSALAGQKEMRVDWLKHYDDDFALLQKWRANRTLKNLAPLMGEEFVAPYRTSYSDVADALPSLVNRNSAWSFLSWGEISPSYPRQSSAKAFNLQTTYNKSVAESQWKDTGDDYAVWLKKNRPLVEQDLRILATANYGNVSERWRVLAVGPFAFAAVLSAVGLVLNGAVLLLLSLRDRLRQHIWRRQVA